MKYQKLKQEVFDANMQLPALGLVIFTWGNVSAIDREQGVFAIKPSGVEYDALRVEDIVVLSLETGEVVEGDMRPSSDTDTHRHLYQAFSDLQGICHTHSEWAVSWAQSCRSLPAYGTTHADAFYGAVPCTRKLSDEELKSAYEHNTGVVIEECFNEQAIDPLSVPAVLVAGHGPFTWGKSAIDAVHNAKVLEQCCKMAARAERLNPEMQAIEQSLLDKHYLRKHGKDAYYGQE